MNYSFNLPQPPNASPLLSYVCIFDCVHVCVSVQEAVKLRLPTSVVLQSLLFGCRLQQLKHLKLAQKAIITTEKHQESLKYPQLEVNHKSSYVNTTLLKTGVIISPHLCLEKASLCLRPDKAPHHQWFITQRGCCFMRPIQKPWGVTPSHSHVFSSAWFQAVSHLHQGLLSCQPLFTAAKWFSPRSHPSACFVGLLEERVHMQVWAGTANGHGELEWVEKTRPGGEPRAPCWEAAGALNSESECNADQWNLQLYCYRF